MKAELRVLLENITRKDRVDVTDSGLVTSPRLHSCLTDPNVEMMNIMTILLKTIIHVKSRALEGLDTRIMGSYHCSRHECTSVLRYCFLFVLRGPYNFYIRRSKSNTK
jgi:hypothetical protein